MMKNLPYLFLIVIALLFSSCAKNIVTNYQEDTENTGSLMIIPNKPMYKASVTMKNILNKDADKLIISNSNIKTLKINNIPDGIYGLEFIYNNNNLYPIKSNELTVRIQKNKTSSKLIQIPPPSLGNYIIWSALIIGLLFLPPGPHH